MPGYVNLTSHMPIDLVGPWKLVSWRRLEEGGQVTYPLGEDATGLLIYTADFKMAVQIVAAGRTPIRSNDPFGGDADERAAAYSTCLAYSGAYEVQGECVIHHVDSSLYPNWSGAVQSRPFSYDGKTLVLRTPPSQGDGGSLVYEISWVRA